MTWVSASSIPVLEYVAKRELKNDGATPQEAGIIVKGLIAVLLDKVNVLSNFSWHMSDNYHRCSDIEDAQISLAASELHGETIIVTADCAFYTLDLVPKASPQQALEWVHKESAESAEIGFIDLKAQQDAIRPQLERNIHRVLHHGAGSAAVGRKACRVYGCQTLHYCSQWHRSTTH